MPTPPLARHRLLLPRRGFLVGAAASLAVAACGGSSSGDRAAPDAEAAVGDGTLWLQAGFADGFRVPSTLASGRPERAPFVIYDGNGLPAVNGLPAEVEMTLTAPDGGESTVVVARRDDDIPTPYYALEFTPDDPGTYQVTVDLNGEPQQVDFMVADPAGVALVAPGDTMRSVATPTFDDALGFDPICTRFDTCPFHDISLDEALANGRPTALLVATPGFCQTVICGPVLELLIELDPSADMNVIHAEVYNEPERINEIGLVPELLAPVITTYGMDFEPSFVVADGAGRVTSRLDYTFDRTEMAAALATATG